MIIYFLNSSDFILQSITALSQNTQLGLDHISIIYFLIKLSVYKTGFIILEGIKFSTSNSKLW